MWVMNLIATKVVNTDAVDFFRVVCTEATWRIIAVFPHQFDDDDGREQAYVPLAGYDTKAEAQVAFADFIEWLASDGEHTRTAAVHSSVYQFPLKPGKTIQ